MDESLHLFNPNLNLLVSIGLSGEGTGPPAIDEDGMIWVPTDNGLDVVLPSEKKVDDTFELPAEKYTNLPYGLTPVIAAGGYVYYSMGHHLWKLKLDDGARRPIVKNFVEAGNAFTASAPVIAGDMVVIGSKDGKLYAKRVATSLADSPWPMFGRDQYHTGSVP